jgi:hypothetical protein
VNGPLVLGKVFVSEVAAARPRPTRGDLHLWSRAPLNTGHADLAAKAGWPPADLHELLITDGHYFLEDPRRDFNPGSV